MAIAPTGNIFKTLEFDGEPSYQYGVYISGAGVFDAPERDVEMITIPGRNGSFSLDNGRFQNVEVTYPAGIFADTDADFAQAISDFRNFLCSRKGYCRLTDDYNPDEYRMAIYKSGLDVKLSELKAGEFNITFNCKPQRFLMSGETAISVTSGETLLNPTLFESHPMLEVTGYGNIGINGETISVQHVPLGEIQISNASTDAVTLNTTNVNTGDAIYKKAEGEPSLTVGLTCNKGDFRVQIVGTVVGAATMLKQVSPYKYTLSVAPTIGNFYKGTTASVTVDVPLIIRYTGGSYHDAVLRVAVAYNASTERISISSTTSQFPSSSDVSRTYSEKFPAFYADSTKTALPMPMYIDLDIGEAYGEIGGERMPLNNLVSMPAELPVLDAGTNTITYDNTVTDLKIVPRWWKI